MRILISGICGFVGSSLARSFHQIADGIEVFGFDSLVRAGTETNRRQLREIGISVLHGDVRVASDMEGLPAADWLIDAAANPSVLAGVDGRVSSRQTVEHNLYGTVNLLEYCKRHGAGFTLLSTSRVYSIPSLSGLPMKVEGASFVLDESQGLPPGVSAAGIREEFSTAAPVSLYGSTKLASEVLALEYGCTFGFPVWINRCGVLAGAGQFGTVEQGIFSYWIHAHAARRPLRYIGFGGSGLQVRDAFHPHDLTALLGRQIHDGSAGGQRIFNAGGGARNAMSLAELTAFCDSCFGVHAPAPDSRPRPFDLPWVVMDSGAVEKRFGWIVEFGIRDILNEIAEHARTHSDWLDSCDVK